MIKPTWAPILFHDFQESRSIEITMLFHALFLYLAGGKYHVCSSSTCAEATLTFREETLLKMLQQAIKQNTGREFACY